MKKLFNICNRVKYISDRGGEIYIRCAGRLGMQLCREMEECGIYITAFIDNDVNKQIEIDKRIISTDNISGMQPGGFFIMIAVEDDAIYHSVAMELSELGLKEGEDYGDFSDLLVDRRMMTFMDIIPEYDMYKLNVEIGKCRLGEMNEIDSSFNEQIPDHNNIIANLDVPLTTFCSLRCKYCSHCIPSIEKPRHFDAKKIIKDIEKVISVSYIACLAIMGGEPLLYPDIVEFLRLYNSINDRKNIGFTRIVTNGTILPTDEFFEVASKIERFQIYISNYGTASKAIDSILDKCAIYGIKTYVCPDDFKWVDLGTYSHERDYSIEQLRHLYAVCEAKMCTQLYDGNLYSCARIPALNEEGLIPHSDTDYFDVRDAQLDTLENDLHDYLYGKGYLDGCKYCDGQHYFSWKIDKGEQ